MLKQSRRKRETLFPSSLLDLLCEPNWRFPLGAGLEVAKKLPEGGVSLRTAVFEGSSESYQRSTLADPPDICFSTSARVTMVVSPGVVMARAPWAAPYSTAFAASPCAINP